MRGRKPKKEKAPRARREKIVTAGRPLVYCPGLGNRRGILIREGAEQSVVYFDTEVEHMSREMIMPNTWFKRGVPRLIPRVKLETKIKRVRL